MEYPSQFVGWNEVGLPFVVLQTMFKIGISSIERLGPFQSESRPQLWIVRFEPGVFAAWYDSSGDDVYIYWSEVDPIEFATLLEQHGLVLEGYGAEQ
jgi:hypothetical protein